MSEHLQKFFSFGIQQALYEKDTSQGHLAVYQTSPFGLLLTLNGQALISESDSFFSYEMMAHPALFTHSKPQQIALLGNHFGILAEVLKHPSVVSVSCILENRDIQEAVATYFSHCLVTQTDSRVTYATENTLQWLTQREKESLDVLLMNQVVEDITHYVHEAHRILRKNGLLLMSCPFGLMETTALNALLQTLKQTAFHDWQLLNFPQPSCPPGWRTLLMGIKQSNFKRIREKDIFNKTFSTRYYNFDTHKAALALPEFMRMEVSESLF